MCGNFSTKIFLANTDPTTTEWMSSMIGKSQQFSVSANGSEQAKLFGRPNFSVSRQREPDIHPEDFQRLRNGGPPNQYEVDSIVLLGAKAVQAIGRPWEQVVFTQLDDAGGATAGSGWWSDRFPVRLVRGVFGLL